MIVTPDTILRSLQAPNANAHAERFVRSIREECLDGLILFGERRLIRAVDGFVAHYHRERNHQGLGNRLIAPEVRGAIGTHIRCHERLGGAIVLLPPRGLSPGMSFRTLWVPWIHLGRSAPADARAAGLTRL
jgi:transposase InsO family protein